MRGQFMKLLEHTTDELQSIGGHDLIEIFSN